MPPVAEPPVESPRRLPDAYQLLSDADGAAWRPIAGGTDLLVQITGDIGEPPGRVLDIWRLDELRGIQVDGESLTLGALTTYTEIRRSPLVAEFLPALAECAATIGAAQIQNRGTIGGKVVMALVWRPEDGGAWHDVRLALGSVAPTTIRAPRTEAVLAGAQPTRETADRAASVMEDDIHPIDDVRSTADYRRA